MKHLVTIVFWWLLASGGTSVTGTDDDEVAVLVTRIESSSSVRISTTHRQSAAQRKVPARNSNARHQHPFLYKKDYKHWLGLKTGPSNNSFWVDRKTNLHFAHIKTGERRTHKRRDKCRFLSFRDARETHTNGERVLFRRFTVFLLEVAQRAGLCRHLKKRNCFFPQ